MCRKLSHIHCHKLLQSILHKSLDTVFCMYIMTTSASATVLAHLTDETGGNKMNRHEQIDYRLANSIAACRGETLRIIELIIKNHTSTEAIREMVIQAINENDKVERLRIDESNKHHDWLGNKE